MGRTSVPTEWPCSPVPKPGLQERSTRIPRACNKLTADVHSRPHRAGQPHTGQSRQRSSELLAQPRRPQLHGAVLVVAWCQRPVLQETTNGTSGPNPDKRVGQQLCLPTLLSALTLPHGPRSAWSPAPTQAPSLARTERPLPVKERLAPASAPRGGLFSAGPDPRRHCPCSQERESRSAKELLLRAQENNSPPSRRPSLGYAWGLSRGPSRPQQVSVTRFLPAGPGTGHVAARLRPTQPQACGPPAQTSELRTGVKSLLSATRVRPVRVGGADSGTRPSSATRRRERDPPGPAHCPGLVSPPGLESALRSAIVICGQNPGHLGPARTHPGARGLRGHTLQEAAGGSCASCGSPAPWERA